MDKKFLKTAFFLAASEAAYILLVATLMRGAEKFLGDKPDNFLAPLTFLLLFVISAAISAALVFGKPVLLYLENKKEEAVRVFAFTLGWLALFFAAAITVLILV
ncbi:MAG TPA: hypothetical protein DCX32_04375 [Candidatus Moranbacteria bacterium]|nr:MAG: hypothetical protein UW87_C0002G0011 [Candidatus Moranbacteria bacterium GW2011_GWC2_45_10]KKT95182.1 MAG: hypothetical protein UW95_C0003G0024 [Parcubacteria group bacterium GW2011_GWC1_45_14]HAV11743.1 hypothetical protein [Candidatus Moranbacteria bacterium]